MIKPTQEQLASYWKARALSIGQAQARYLWALIVLGVFFWSLQGATSDQGFAIPVLGISLNARVLQAAAPLVLFLLIVVTHGTLRAYGAAVGELGLPRDPGIAPSEGHHKLAEALDASPNPLDFAAFTRFKWSPSVWTLLLLNYPLYLAFFLVEGLYLWIGARSVAAPARDTSVLLVVGAILGVVAAVQTVSLAWTRVVRIVAIYSRATRSQRR